MSNYYILTNLLSDDERRVITSIVRHIELGGNKVGIQQIASENYVSTAFIMKLCKRLGFAGYSELYYNLAQSSGEGHRSSDPDPLCGLIDGYTPEQAEQFCKMLMQYKERKIFVVGEGFAEEVANYIVKRLAICGFMVFNHVHFYDYMLFPRGRRTARSRATWSPHSSSPSRRAARRRPSSTTCARQRARAFPPSASRAARIPSWRGCRT